VVEHLPSKCEAPEFNPWYLKKKKKKEKKKRKKYFLAREDISFL
jgi:hypothetical protein